MGISSSWACCAFLLYLLALFLSPFRTIGTALPRGFLSPNSSWNTNFSAPNNTVVFRTVFSDGSIARSILVSENVTVFEDDIEYACGCGFFCNPPCNSFLFATFVLYYYKGDSGTSVATDWGPHVVWSANPNNPVSAKATLQFTSKSGLVLLNAGGTEVWSANITNKYVASLKLTPTCNLVFRDKNNKTIWQSHEHPTDTLFREQKLLVGKSLTSKEGLFSLNLTSEGIFAYINFNPPQLYFSYNISGSDINISGIEFRNGSIALLDPKTGSQELELPGRSARFARYARFENDGHLRVYTFSPNARDDILLATQLYSCDFPLACGNYGVCENKGESCKQCTCLTDKNKNGTRYFKAINETEPDQGCTLVTNLSCEGEALDRHSFLEVENIANFRFSAQDPPDIKPDHRSIPLEKCKEECRKRNCSCKAAIYYYKLGSSTGDCYLESQNFSMMMRIPELQYPSMRFKTCIKVQDVKEQSVQRQKHGLEIIVGSSITFGLFLLIGSFVFLLWKKRSADEGEEYYLDHLPGMPTRYSYDDLQAITENFNKKLGAGGFGTVFEGTLIDGTKVAVKRLDGLNQIKRSFLAEIETIGSIHHFNLVRLIGFCAEKSHWLLVYEYMSNGSLDRWVFDKNLGILLDWQCRMKIVLDIARGLTYLHEECWQKIVHLDIKPQNILLDENFNAKVSDFGLSKLVDRDQSQVVTIMRGTPGYMAPEWLSSIITEKVDVYSFGVVLLEILCGRRNIDRSQPEEAMHLLNLFKKKIEEDQLLDLVDKYSEDMQLHGAKVVNTMRVAAWCLQIDFMKRPSMSTVIKVLEDVANVEYDLGYFFSNPLLPSTSAGADNQRLHVGDSDTTQLLPSILSGPR
ncbi:G-type lectin S-receptor-like serine/threonine-protein kinase SD2-5 [Quercus lobata]|nr:G-type lectin S-receptor-like serine/threonine-protein kinase SD2-5 [Quercus lobata]